MERPHIMSDKRRMQDTIHMIKHENTRMQSTRDYARHSGNESSNNEKQLLNTINSTNSRCIVCIIGGVCFL